MGKIKKHLVVIYHDGCIDGLASAWAFDQKWGDDPDVSITYVPYNHGNIEGSEKNILSALTPASEICFTDVAPRKEFLDVLFSPDTAGRPKAAAIRVIDHHKTAAGILSGYRPPAAAGCPLPPLSVFIDENRPSASNMVWEALFPEREIPPFIRMLDKMDRDHLTSEEDFSAAAFIDSKSIASITAAFNACSELSHLNHPQMAEAGQGMLADQKNRVAKLSDQTMFTRLEILPDLPPLYVPIVNADVKDFGRPITAYLKDLGNKTGAGVAFAWYVRKDGGVTMSIRSDGNPDASLVAAHLCRTMGITGGGHDTSAAVSFSSLAQFCAHIPLHPDPAGPDKNAPQPEKPPGFGPMHHGPS